MFDFKHSLKKHQIKGRCDGARKSLNGGCPVSRNPNDAKKKSERKKRKKNRFDGNGESEISVSTTTMTTTTTTTMSQHFFNENEDIPNFEIVDFESLFF